MELVTRDRPNVSLRRLGDGGQWVVLSFPYDAHLVNLARSIPHRRFDWDTREWIGAGHRLGRDPRAGHPRALPGARGLR